MERSKSSGERKGVLEDLLQNMNIFLNKSTLYFPPFVACVQVRASLCLASRYHISSHGHSFERYFAHHTFKLMFVVESQLNFKYAIGLDSIYCHCTEYKYRGNEMCRHP